MPIALGSAYGEIEIGTGGAERNVNTLASSMRRVGQTMSLAVTAPLLAVAGAGLKAAAGFETSMNVIQSVSDATATQMAQMQSIALQLGKDTSFSAGEAAEGMLELAKAGLSAEESMAAIPGVLDLAAAGSIEVAQAAEITANALNAFNLPASESVRVADLLAAAANASSAEMSDLAQGFQQAGFIFNASGQGVDDLAASLAILTNVGLTGSDAGTALKNAFTRIINPTKEANAVLDELGISFFDAAGNMKGMPDIIDDLNVGLAGMTQEQRLAALSTIFLSDGAKALIPLLDVGKEGFLAMKDSVNEAGAAQEVAEARMKGLAGAVDYAKGTIESALISAFLPFTSSLGDMIRKGADLIGKFAELPEPVRNAALAFAAVLAVAGPILVALPMIGAVLGALLSSIGLVVLAVAGLAAAWAADFGGIREKTAAVIAALQPALDRLKSYLEMIKGGDWSGLTNAVFADVGAMLSAASATIAAFDWAEWIDGVLDWAAYIGKIAWDAFLTLVDWQLYIWKLEWDLFVTALDWAAGWITSLPWADYVTALSDWGTWVLSLDWAGYVSKLSDWATYVKGLAWETFVSALTWGADYIASLDWAGFIATLSDWGQWIASLDWTKVITTVIDWMTWIPALTWNSFVKMLDWLTIVTVFAWTEWISKLTWADFVAALSWGGDKVSKLQWSDFVAVLDWVGKIAEFAWDSFVSKLEWPLISQFDWASWIDSFHWPRLPSFSWSSWISSFNWPSLPSFSWSSWISGFSWPSLPSFNWRDFIPELKWPSIPAFSWPTIKLPCIPGFAAGTAFAPGGLALVGERGPEFIDLPRGSRVYDAQETTRMGGDGATTINNIYQVADSLDIEAVAYRVAQVMQRRMR